MSVLAKMPYIDFAVLKAEVNIVDVLAMLRIANLKKQGDQQRAADEALQAAYIGFRRSRAKAIFQTLPAEEKVVIEALAKRGSKNGFSAKTGSLGSLMLDLDIAKITAERHSDRIPSLEQWQAKMDA